MHRYLWLLIPVLLTTGSACGRTEHAQPLPAAEVARERDIHSFARPDEARVTHVALDLRADFDARTLAGRATLALDRAAGADEIVLDTRDLDIERVTDPGDQPLDFALGDADPILGRALTVHLPAGVREIAIDYRTSPTADALQWLAPEQTAGRRHPYLYSQGQAILTRTWIPTQDSPGIRQTYSARIAVPPDLRAVMSAEHLTPDGNEGAHRRTFEFRLAEPIPPYLIALAVGDITFREIGPRTGVYAEPPVIEAAQHEDRKSVV